MTTIEIKFNKNDAAYFIKSPSEIHKILIKSTKVEIEGVTPEISYTAEDGRVFKEKELLTKEELLKQI